MDLEKRIQEYGCVVLSCHIRDEDLKEVFRFAAICGNITLGAKAWR